MGAIQSALGMLIGLAVAAFVHDTLFELGLLMLFCAIATGVAYLFTRKASTARDAAA
jgi:hypothetical protein